MRIFNFNFVFILSIITTRSQGIEDKKENGDNAYRDLSNNSSQNEIKGANNEPDVVFIAYNSLNPNGTRLTLAAEESELKSVLLKNKNTTFITHGWLGSENSSYIIDISIAYLQKTDINVIVVGWSKISRNEYIITTLRVPEVGTTVGKMISTLLNASLATLDDIHLIGHSLGAHVMGIAGGFVRDAGYGKVRRITGLDPAKPFYQNIRGKSERLDSNDGMFVDVIHTSSGVFGYSDPLGDADFFPNGGTDPQPGCEPEFLKPRIFCSHFKALEYYKESIYNEKAFPSVKCDSFSNYESHRCENETVVYMG